MTADQYAAELARIRRAYRCGTCGQANGAHTAGCPHGVTR